MADNTELFELVEDYSYCPNGREIVVANSEEEFLAGKGTQLTAEEDRLLTRKYVLDLVRAAIADNLDPASAAADLLLDYAVWSVNREDDIIRDLLKDARRLSPEELNARWTPEARPMSH